VLIQLDKMFRHPAWFEEAEVDAQGIGNPLRDTKFAIPAMFQPLAHLLERQRQSVASI